MYAPSVAMSSKRMTVNDVADIVEFLSRVVPRGQVEADRLEKLIGLLERSIVTNKE